MLDLAIFLTVALLFAALLLAVWRWASGHAGRRLWRGALCLVTALLLAGWGDWTFSGLRTFQISGEIVPRIATADPVVALTFDDGPKPGATEQVLQMLHAEDVKATFFLNGRDIVENPEQARQIVRAGHEIGNHSYTHPRMVGLSLQRLRSEIERTDAEIRRAEYTGEIHFRSPYGRKYVALPYVLSRMERKNIFWDVEPETYVDVASSADGITQHVLEHTRPGSIILLHVMFPSREPSLNAVPAIIRGLKQKGYRFVPVSELLAAGKDG